MEINKKIRALTTCKINNLVYVKLKVSVYLQRIFPIGKSSRTLPLLILHKPLGTNSRMKTFQIFIIFFLINFSVKSQEKLGENLTIKSVFNKIEIQDLALILDFFDNGVCKTENIDKSNISDCYQSFFERMAESEKTGIIEFRISFNEQKLIYKKISQSTFNEIWTFGKSWKRESSQKFKYLSYNLNGKYAEYLEELGNENKIIKNYIDTLLAAGDISPIMFANVLMGYKNYDITDIRIRLMIAIHYMTLNDQEERNEKY